MLRGGHSTQNLCDLTISQASNTPTHRKTLVAKYDDHRPTVEYLNGRLLHERAKCLLNFGIADGLLLNHERDDNLILVVRDARRSCVLSFPKAREAIPGR